MNEFTCTVHMKEHLTVKACRYFLHHAHVKAWVMPLVFLITCISVLTLYMYLVDPNCPLGSIFFLLILPISIAVDLIFIAVMPIVIRSVSFQQIKRRKMEISQGIPISITPKKIQFPTGDHIDLVEGRIRFGLRKRGRADTTKKRPFMLSNSVYVSPYGIFFGSICAYIGFFIGRQDLPSDQFSALCKMLKEHSSAQYYEI